MRFNDRAGESGVATSAHAAQTLSEWGRDPDRPAARICTASDVIISVITLADVWVSCQNNKMFAHFSWIIAVFLAASIGMM